MKVAVLGTGNMGSGLARRLASANHTLALRGRNAAKTAELAQSLRAGTAASAARDADVIIIATPYSEAVGALREIGDLNGKVVVDITNPLTPDFSGTTIGFTTSAAEEIQKAFPGARVVKAFNTVFAQLLAGSEPVPVYIAGDDHEAKKLVQQLVTDIGFKPVDAGLLKNARHLEPLAVFNIYLGYTAGHGTIIYPVWRGV